MKTKLLLVVSARMNDNKKKERYEDKLIRMGQKTRDHLGLTDDKQVELWPNGSTGDKIARSKILAIFKAYSSDIKKLREEGMSEEDILRVGFVTSRTFNSICGGNNDRDIWLADTIEDTIIGGDPEFILVTDNGAVKYAAEVENFHHAAKLGSDGPWAELRPDPEVKAEDFVKNIKDLLTTHDAVNKINRYRWVGGCYYNKPQARGFGVGREDWPIGGHIHIGTPLKIAEEMHKDGKFMQGTHATIQKILDELVAIPMMKVEGVEASCKRRNQYGRYGENRKNGPGGERLEYRTLSGQWLIHPKLALAVLGTVKAVSHAIFKEIEDGGMKNELVASNNIIPGHSYFVSDHWEDIELINKYGATKQNAEMRSILERGEVDFSRRQVNKMKQNLRGLITYNDYRDHIDTFCEVISQSEEVLQNQETDLKKTWIEGQDFII